MGRTSHHCVGVTLRSNDQAILLQRQYTVYIRAPGARPGLLLIQKFLFVPVDENFGQRNVMVRPIPLATVEVVDKKPYENCELEIIYRVKRIMRIIRDQLTHDFVLSSILTT